ncbi:hypothetical protein IWX50DRAFT_255705 [Phyllosticta citricarpa]
MQPEHSLSRPAAVFFPSGHFFLLSLSRSAGVNFSPSIFFQFFFFFFFLFYGSSRVDQSNTSIKAIQVGRGVEWFNASAWEKKKKETNTSTIATFEVGKKTLVPKRTAALLQSPQSQRNTTNMKNSAPHLHAVVRVPLSPAIGTAPSPKRPLPAVANQRETR